jgi:short-subunit dehydrogenase
MNVNNKIIVVTGAGSGIGQALVLNLLEKGAKVAAIDLRPDSLEELKKIVGGIKRLTTHIVDISDKKAVEALPKDVINQQGGVDGIINCAGIIQPFLKINDLEYAAIDKVMDINFFGTLYIVKSFLPHLLAPPEAHIVNTSSMGGFLPVPGQSIYGASKAAVKLLTEGLYAELKNTNVRVSVVFPGATRTNITVNSGVKQPMIGSKDQNFSMLLPDEVAKDIISGIEKNKFQIFTGKDSKSMNILYRISPKFAANLIAKQMQSLLQK